ncbi:ABC transporter permease, partial [Halococcus sp. IIIV-5B]|uniref:ABC transporter permease n=1 Tax=Halococcus sp. IIIV-5B TaxID=2321230 RepID=UPI000ED9D163
MNPRSYRKLVEAHAKRLAREPTTLFFTLAFPLLFLLLIGTVFDAGAGGAAGGAGGGAADAYSYGIDQLVPALVGVVLGSIALTTIPVSTASDREQGVLRRFKASPMPAWRWVATEVTTYFVVALLGVLLLVIGGLVVYDVRFSGSWAAVFTGFSLSAFSFIAFGYLVASLSPTPRVASVVGQVLYMPMLFVSGAVMPLSALPDWLHAVAEVLPMTHVVRVMQALSGKEEAFDPPA